MRRIPLVIIVLFTGAFSAFAQEANGTDAAAKGAKYLQGVFADPKVPENSAFKAGEAGLAGLAMLEAGIKPDDKSIQNIANYIRSIAPTQHETYQVALSLLFLDKLGEKTESRDDRGTIQLLGTRLYAGMNANGGWGYTVWEPIGEEENKRWTAALAVPVKQDVKIHPDVARLFQTVIQTLGARGRSNDIGDNSNTQFGMIGLWVAARHGIPVADAFPLIEARFARTFGKDGGWSYTPGEAAKSSLSMTCAGLLGLAIGEASRAPAPKEVKPDPAKPKDDPFFNPGKPVVGKNPGGPNRSVLQKTAILSVGQVLLATSIKKPPGPNERPAVDALSDYKGEGNIYYMLWCVERCAVAYGLDSFGDIDWYRWGLNYLLPLQETNGSWHDGSYTASVNTSFAILFLMKANSYRDLSNRIKGQVKDPGMQELRNNNAKPLFQPGGNNPAVVVKPDPAPGGGFKPPVEIAPKEPEAVAQRVQVMLASNEADWPTKVAEVREAKGAEYTRSLVLVCNSAEGERKKQAREALAERLTRMTAKTLKEMLLDVEDELRRAACLACGMKELEESIPWLIERLTDPSDSVCRAAKASLVSLAGVDHGPASGADAEAKLKSATAWRTWYDAKKGK